MKLFLNVYFVVKNLVFPREAGSSKDQARDSWLCRSTLHDRSQVPISKATKRGSDDDFALLNSRSAIEVNVLIMRAFVKTRRIADTHKDLRLQYIKSRNDFIEGGAVRIRNGR